MQRRGVHWFVFLGGPMAWAGHFLASYLLVTLACGERLPMPRFWLAALTIAGVAMTTAAGLAGYRSWRALDAGPRPNPISSVARGRFIVVTGLGLSGLFLFAIVLGAAPVVVLRSWCS